MEIVGRRAEHADGGEREASLLMMNIAEESEESEEIREIAAGEGKDPGPHVFGEERWRDRELTEKRGSVFEEVEGVHTEVNASRAEGGDQVLFRAADEKEARNVRIRLHGASQGLLRDVGEGVSVVDDHPSVNAAMGGHLADEESDGTADGLDAAILFRAELEGFEGLMCGGVCPIAIEKRAQERRLSRAWWAREKEMCGPSQVGEARGPYGVLTDQGCGWRDWCG